MVVLLVLVVLVEVVVLSQASWELLWLTYIVVVVVVLVVLMCQASWGSHLGTALAQISSLSHGGGGGVGCIGGGDGVSVKLGRLLGTARAHISSLSQLLHRGNSCEEIFAPKFGGGRLQSDLEEGNLSVQQRGSGRTSRG